jgi:hypothetical protein
MSLFDISERIFALKSPEMGVQLLQSFRASKGRDSMVGVNHGIREQVDWLSMLLPAEI